MHAAVEDCAFIPSFEMHARQAQQSQLDTDLSNQVSPFSLVVCSIEPFILNMEDGKICLNWLLTSFAGSASGDVCSCIQVWLCCHLQWA